MSKVGFILLALIAVAGGVWFALSYERATLYKCTACFAEDPSKCATRIDDTDHVSADENTARIDVTVELCGKGNESHAAAFAECVKAPPERFNISCSSWRQWARKRHPNPYVVH